MTQEICLICVRRLSLVLLSGERTAFSLQEAKALAQSIVPWPHAQHRTCCESKLHRGGCKELVSNLREFTIYWRRKYTNGKTTNLIFAFLKCYIIKAFLDQHTGTGTLSVGWQQLSTPGAGNRRMQLKSLPNVCLFGMIAMLWQF